ncbi:hypothetical protein BGW36DRAFT_378322 [Talaromyces proteolyticus]|uniref:Aminoglycoside phosphotransferase domain-containing protein n=1 Tax=Talaromyces proteolyticus TaxID=1131652 RepID=A0AAD4KVV3_9EURO|nr:uncharacterized protein BGW36DRAFT_378322 [Talaromyces proteolyticus]KAH8697254.1 hypothetical protein BGW36DRAFT_378322 [Talaromyces proteolyticus]
MNSDNNAVEEALSLIESVGLPHPQGPLLASFVTEAVSPSQAARYVSDRLFAGESSSIVSDWTYLIECITRNGRLPPQLDAQTQSTITRRDGVRCCVTGKKGTFWDPLLVLPILPIPSGWDTEKVQIFNMLGAFFGPQYRDWWLSYVRNPNLMPPHYNHWLVRQSTAKALTLGLIKLDRLQPSIVEYEVSHVLIGPEEPLPVDGTYPLLGDHSRSGIEKIDPRFVGTHSRLCRSIRFLELTKRLAADNLPQVSGSSIWCYIWQSPVQSQMQSRKRFSLTTCATGTFLAVWLMFPRKFRISSYNILRRVGEYIYGKSNGYSTVQRLPFGLYLKFQGQNGMFRNELNALRIVRKYTSIPTPDPLDIVTESGHANDPFPSPKTYLLITRLPGLPLSRCQDVLSDRDCEQVSNQLGNYLAQLRDIPKVINTDMAICNTLGEACQDPRILGGLPVGPFKDEAAFSQTLRYSDDSARRGHKIVLTHADLNPRNILVDQVTRSDGSRGWVVTGIVDWETSGYYPDYWDYTKAMFEGFRWSRRYNDMIRKVFREFGDYSKEYDVEKRSWELGDGV